MYAHPPEILQRRVLRHAATRAPRRGHKLRAAILGSISREDVQAITRVLIDQAKAGDQGAAKILLSYIGKPTEGPDVAIQFNASQTSSREPGRAVQLLERIRARLAAEQTG